jgi:hypothetical protein
MLARGRSVQAITTGDLKVEIIIRGEAVETAMFLRLIGQQGISRSDELPEIRVETTPRGVKVDAASEMGFDDLPDAVQDAMDAESQAAYEGGTDDESDEEDAFSSIGKASHTSPIPELGGLAEDDASLPTLRKDAIPLIGDLLRIYRANPKATLPDVEGMLMVGDITRAAVRDARITALESMLISTAGKRSPHVVTRLGHRWLAAHPELGTDAEQAAAEGVEPEPKPEPKAEPKTDPKAEANGVALKDQIKTLMTAIVAKEQEPGIRRVQKILGVFNAQTLAAVDPRQYPELLETLQKKPEPTASTLFE